MKDLIAVAASLVPAFVVLMGFSGPGVTEACCHKSIHWFIVFIFVGVQFSIFCKEMK